MIEKKHVKWKILFLTIRKKIGIKKGKHRHVIEGEILIFKRSKSFLYLQESTYFIGLKTDNIHTKKSE